EDTELSFEMLRVVADYPFDNSDQDVALAQVLLCRPSVLAPAFARLSVLQQYFVHEHLVRGFKSETEGREARIKDYQERKRLLRELDPAARRRRLTSGETAKILDIFHKNDRRRHDRRRSIDPDFKSVYEDFYDVVFEPALEIAAHMVCYDGDAKLLDEI